jgi:hypothetical protein
VSGRGYPDRDPQLFYELARDRHTAQASLLDSLDSKLGLLLAASSALLSILVAVYALRPSAFDTGAFLLLFASAAVRLLLSVFALQAIWPRGWESGPKLADIFDDQFSDETTRRSSGSWPTISGTPTTRTSRYRIERGVRSKLRSAC